MAVVAPRHLFFEHQSLIWAPLTDSGRSATYDASISSTPSTPRPVGPLKAHLKGRRPSNQLFFIFLSFPHHVATTIPPLALYFSYHLLSVCFFSSTFAPQHITQHIASA
jgi:hypothetical protein